MESLYWGDGNSEKLGCKYDGYVNSLNEPHILVGPSALWRAGLTTCFTDRLYLSTLCPYLNGINVIVAEYYFSPWADKYFEINPLSDDQNIKVPTKERALVEYILLKDNFDEGLLIEGLKTYMFQMDDDVSRLYEVLPMFGVKDTKILDYWINEAIEDDSVCGA